LSSACAQADTCVFSPDCEFQYGCLVAAENDEVYVVYEENLLDEAIADEVWGRSQPTEET